MLLDLIKDETIPKVNFDLLKQFWEDQIAVDNKDLDENHNFDNDDSVAALHTDNIVSASLRQQTVLGCINESTIDSAGPTPEPLETLGPLVQPKGASIDPAFSLESCSFQLTNSSGPAATVQREAFAGIVASP